MLSNFLLKQFSFRGKNESIFKFTIAKIGWKTTKIQVGCQRLSRLRLWVLPQLARCPGKAGPHPSRSREDRAASPVRACWGWAITQPAGRDGPHECTRVPVSLEMLKISSLLIFQALYIQLSKFRDAGQPVLRSPLYHAGDGTSGFSCVPPDTRVGSGKNQVLADVSPVAMTVHPPCILFSF